MLTISWIKQLIIDFSNFYINICSGLDQGYLIPGVDNNENVNSRINLICVGAFHPNNI